jgi:hypothetical protein
MESVVEQNIAPFVDRRQSGGVRGEASERRQFAASTSHLAPDVQELAQTIDRYKLVHRRRFITVEELYAVITGLGYHK